MQFHLKQVLDEVRWNTRTSFIHGVFGTHNWHDWGKLFPTVTGLTVRIMRMRKQGKLFFFHTQQWSARYRLHVTANREKTTCPDLCIRVILLFSGIARTFPSGWLAHPAGQNKEENKFEEKIRKFDWNLRKIWGKWNSCPPRTVRLATALLLFNLNKMHHF